MSLWNKYQSQIPTSIFNSSGNLALIIRILLNELDVAYTAAKMVHLLTSVQDMAGQQIDNIGAIVGQLRAGMTDAQYKPVLQAALIAAASRGDRYTILSILQVMGYTVRSFNDGEVSAYLDAKGFFDGTILFDGYVGQGKFTVTVAATGNNLQGLLNQIKAAGVNAIGVIGS